jgi:hypothetical protein
MSKGEIICNYLVVKSKFKFEYESENSPPNDNDDGNDNDWNQNQCFINPIIPFIHKEINLVALPHGDFYIKP